MTIASLLLVLLTAAPQGAPTAEPVLLDFHAEWCGPCRQMRPVVARLAREGYPVKSIDIDHAPEMKEKYGVDAVPTFVVVDSSGKELARTSGSQPAAQLARFYQDARARARPPANSRAHAGGDGEDEGDASGDAADEKGGERQDTAAAESTQDADQDVFQNPKPWETVVRIRVLAQGSVGFGSGTVIHSTPKEALILTCAHIFKLDGRRQAPPDRFPRKIMIDLFDGKLHGQRPAQVHFVESVEGKAVDYDFGLDVGLIRIRPGRRLPCARVVPAHWKPKSKMAMLTVGCSEGQDATAWYTYIINPQMRGLAGNPNYQAIECMIAPKQGRSGGGLFTDDGYVAGVCNFAEPRGNHGLYATPQSIYSMLDRNQLMALYAPVRHGSETLVAGRERGERPRRRGEEPITIARAQSPDGHDAERPAARPGDLTVPDPELLGIKSPQTRRVSSERESSTRRMAWHPTPASPAPEADSAAATPIEKASPTDLNLDPAADHDHFSHFEPDTPEPEPKSKSGSDETAVNSEDVPSAGSGPDASAAPSSGKSRWRRARGGGTPIPAGATR